MVQNIEVLRFADAMLESLWDSKYISNIQVTLSEVLGVEDRGGYYEPSGALKGMMQNHVSQIVALLAMEVLISLNSEDIRVERVEILKSLRHFQSGNVKRDFVHGQYDEDCIDGEQVKAYRDENHVADGPNAPTLVSDKLIIDSFRWVGVPFYIRTGKRMKPKTIQVVVELKEAPMDLYYETDKLLGSGLLVINIQPNEGVSLHLSAKENIQSTETEPVQLSYLANAQDKMNTINIYENLLSNCPKDNVTNSTYWEELKSTWKFVGAIQDERNVVDPEFPNYELDTSGPSESDLLLARNGDHWWDDIQ